MFAKKRVLIGIFLADTSVIIRKIFLSAIIRLVLDALPDTHSNLGKFEYILVEGEKIYLDTCKQNFDYLFKSLGNEEISLKDK
jgi:hypothetical protein